MAITTLNAGFAAFGRLCASQKYLVFILSFILSIFLSWPTILELNSQAKSISTHDHFWQYSPQIQPLDLGSALNSTTHIAYKIQFIQQVDKASAEDSAGSERLPVDQMLLARARAWQQALISQPIELDNDGYRKKSITLKHLPSFILISPFDYYWPSSDPIPVNWPSSIDPSRLDPLTVFDHVTLDEHGRLLSADAIVITAVIPRDIAFIWARVVEQQIQNFQLSWHVRQMRAPVHSSQQFWQYRYNRESDLARISLPLVLSTNACLFIALHLLVFYIVSTIFSRSPFVNSPYGLGMAATMISAACTAITLSVLGHFEVNTDAVPWYLLSVVSIVASTENQLLLANAVVHAGCDMSAREKVGRGLQSVGVPMLGTLIAELIILEIGRSFQILVIQQFCQFAQVALIVEYILELTLFLALLSIDINRAELVDLGDRHVSKRLRQLANISHHHPEGSPSMDNLDICPVQDLHPHVARRGTSCPECKEFKTHRAANALMLCLVILSISLVQPLWPSPNSQTTVSFGLCEVTDGVSARPSPSTVLVAGRLEKASTQYWELVNPAHETQWIQVEAPILLVRYVNAPDFSMSLDVPESNVYAERHRTKIYRHHRHQHTGRPSRIRIFAHARVQQILALLWNINFPLCVLLLVFVGMITCLYLSYRNQTLLVLLIKLLETDKTPLWYRLWASLLITATPPQGPSGAEQHQEQAQSVADQLSIKTLSGQHISDIDRFDINQNHHLAVSCSHDDRMVVWDTETGKLVRRINSIYSVKHVRIDRHAKRIATASSDGIVRVWHVDHKKTAPICTFMVEIERHGAAPAVVLTRRHRQEQQDSSSPSLVTRDRVQDIRFIGIAQDHLVTVHKSGVVHEWNVLTGECIHTVSSEHRHGITVLHVVESNHKSPSQTMVSRVFIASKDGRISCWKRQHPAVWKCMYSIPSAHAGGHAITALAVEASSLSGSGGAGLVVSGASDGSIKAWHPETGKPVCTLRDSNPAAVAAAAASKLVITRYCESVIESQPAASCCRHSDACTGSGYLVAAYSHIKNRVSVWRLACVESNSNSATIIEEHTQAHSECYRGHHYKRQRRKGGKSNPVAASATASITMGQAAVRNNPNLQETAPGLQDIEQFGGLGQSELAIFFLGNIHQYGGRGIAFCSSGDSGRLMLTGIRMNRSTGRWEVWSAASLLRPRDVAKRFPLIPVDTLTINGVHDSNDENNDDDGGGNEACELLPFSSVRHVLPLVDDHCNPCGFACDFGNFIKIVNPSQDVSIRPEQTKHKGNHSNV